MLVIDRTRRTVDDVDNDNDLWSKAADNDNDNDRVVDNFDNDLWEEVTNDYDNEVDDDPVIQDISVPAGNQEVNPDPYHHRCRTVPPFNSDLEPDRCKKKAKKI